MKYKVTSSGIKLYDSYKVLKRAMRCELQQVRLQTWGSEVWKRPMRSLLAEWTCHNALYAIGIAREKTNDCDLNSHLPWYADAAYRLFGALVWPFLK